MEEWERKDGMLMQALVLARCTLGWNHHKDSIRVLGNCLSEIFNLVKKKKSFVKMRFSLQSSQHSQKVC